MTKYVSFTGGGPLDGAFLEISFPFPPEIQAPMESLTMVFLDDKTNLRPTAEQVRIGVYKLREYRAYGNYGPVQRAYYFQGEL